jgi:UDP-N-acetylmuramoyl-tripeptide--D-alanyl-D-alanine ligase
MKSFLRKIVVYIITVEARLVLLKYKPKIVAITGSVGKTTTKDAIYTALATSLHVRKSQKSFNSDIGVPLTILGCDNAWSNPFRWAENILRGLYIILIPVSYPEWLVLEVGADRPGDIELTTRLVQPDVAVVTRFGKTPVHVEFFKSRDELIAEKSFLVKRSKSNAFLVLNGDDEDTLKMKELVPRRSIVYSLGGEGDVVGSHNQIYYEKNERQEEVPVGVTFRVNFEGNSVPVVRKGALGLQNIYPTLAAISVAMSQKLNIVSVSEALSHEAATAGRMRLLEGRKETYIIDDTYNSSPVAAHLAVETLAEIKVQGRKIAVLGDMLELGKHSVEEHKRLGEAVAKVADILIVVGIRAKYIAEGALNSKFIEKNIFEFDESESAKKCLDDIMAQDDLILIKGSQSIRMERIVEHIMLDPERKDDLLVRQDKEWKKK